VRLAIVGEGVERERLALLAARLGVRHRVCFAGAREQSELVSWYNAADVLVLCSTMEGSPNVVLESLACGTPVIATAVGGIPEVVQGRAGRLLESRTHTELARAVLDLRSSPPAREEVREFARNFGWEHTVASQLHLFRSVLREVRDGSPAVRSTEAG
jgi:glycosyltransferase involved in cell wall biosynthesis